MGGHGVQWEGGREAFVCAIMKIPIYFEPLSLKQRAHKHAAMEDSTTNMALLREYAKVPKHARHLQVNEINSPGYTALAVAATSKATAEAAAQEVFDFARDPSNHPLAQEAQMLLFGAMASLSALARRAVGGDGDAPRHAQPTNVSPLAVLINCL